MSTRHTLPQALAPYLQLPPEASLTLLTSTVGTSTAWLTSRFVGSFLAPTLDDDNQPRHAVILVSFLRDAKFWAAELRRASGQDITKSPFTDRYAFVDGMALLEIAAATTPMTISSHIERDIIAAVKRLSGKRVTLTLDAPDTLLATSSTEPTALSRLILGLRSKVHSTILALHADLPLLSAAGPGQEVQSTPLELSSAAFLTQQAHAARFVMTVRQLETGAAKDVSGVLRVTRGGDWEDGEDDEDGEGGVHGVKELEALFLVRRDGGLKVFERGSEG